MEIWIVTFILFVTLILFITEIIPVDHTSIGVMAVLMASGILSPAEAVAGFANPAVITVGAMFLISRGLIRTGAVGYIAQKVINLSRGNPNSAMVAILLSVAVTSAFINNTPVVVLFIPIVLHLSCEYGLSPSKYLIPVSYASILAGTCTLIGTSTNIIVSDLSAIYGYGELGMFELSSLGVPIVLLGFVFIYFAAPYLMPGHFTPVCELNDREDKRYLAELEIPAESPLIGQNPHSVFKEDYPSLDVLEVVRKGRILNPFRYHLVIMADDLLLVKGSASELVAILSGKTVVLPHDEEGMTFGSETKDPLIVELIVPPQSTLLQEQLLSTDLQGDPEINIIAVKSRLLHYSRQKIQNIRLRVGDIILVRCPRKKLDQIRGGTDFIIIEDIHHELIDKTKARRAFLIFVSIIVAAGSGVANIMTCAVAGVFMMTVSGCFRLKDAWRYLQPDVLLLIVGTIALGTAMEKSGASKLYAESFLDLFFGAGPSVVLAAFIMLTSLSTHILSNNATAVLLLPIAISTALTLGVDPKPFIVAVCFGASACFATPIGYQTNLLVYGPGGYRFTDYFKLGIPLNVLVILMGSFFIPIIWPF